MAAASSGGAQPMPLELGKQDPIVSLPRSIILCVMFALHARSLCCIAAVGSFPEDALLGQVPRWSSIRVERPSTSDVGCQGRRSQPQTEGHIGAD